MTTVDDTVQEIYRDLTQVSDTRQLLTQLSGFGREAQGYIGSWSSYRYSDSRRLRADSVRRFCEAQSDYAIVAARVTALSDDDFAKGKLIEIAEEYRLMARDAPELTLELSPVRIDAQGLLDRTESCLEGFASKMNEAQSYLETYANTPPSHPKQESLVSFCIAQEEVQRRAAGLAGLNGFFYHVSPRLSRISGLYSALGMGLCHRISAVAIAESRD